ncbi:MAG TPA: branched-chain amino acid ABC transporter permease [Tissierellales bacterium]|jgi:branched-chain amino acid transport system permease protein|uniref:branched-chain amino acid ABC transporter permease n=1 Tax=Gudongella oleilytica TaxID=1582259 RepID=UPI000EBF288B|nr:branched-chain amino acid ABC transporter permease [Gudongella oleilytica]MDY0255857.1 branched-chain amino acid ABC transporter permease [Gudongella oleilytica]HCO18557.1 branched-chain amino acid ABC transporter permease [Tissierellales bacterium]
MSIQEFMQHLVNGTSLGSLYALIAIGYTMVYGILRLINFAHGDIFMLGAYITYYGIAYTPIPWWLVFILSAVITGVFGMVLEKLAYKPLRSAPRITIMISAIGASFLLQNLGVLVFGGRPKAFPIPEVLSKTLVVGGVSVAIVSVVIPIITILLLMGLTFIIQKTKTGMAMRALSKDYEAASLMGIDINRVISFTFFIGSFLAAVGGILWGTKYPQLMPLMGVMPGLKCFIAAVIGGIGNITGAVIGGFILGLGEIMLIAFLPTLTGYRDAFSFILLIVILLVKPTGLMGEKMTEKV